MNDVCQLLKRRYGRGRTFSIVVVAEGAKFKETNMVTQEESLDAFGHVRLGGIGHVLGQEIEKRTGFETRVTVLGHIQRGGSPSAFDRILGTRFGIKAMELVEKGRFGQMASIRGDKITAVSLKSAVGKMKTVDMELYKIARIFFG